MATRLQSARRFVFAVFAALLVPALVAAAIFRGEDTPATARLLADIKYLASDELEGRGVGTKGLDLAAEYVREQFKRAGLKPAVAGESFFQEFELPNGSRLGQTNRLTLNGPNGKTIELAFNKDFIPIALSGTGRFDAPLVFAGYGITAPEFNYDDYADADVKGKVVVVMRHEPVQTEDENPHAPFLGKADTQHAAIKRKAANAARHGAAAILIVTDPYSLRSQPDKLFEFGYGEEWRTLSIPLAQITRSVADTILKSGAGKTLADFEAAIDAGLKPQTAEIKGWRCTGEITVEQKQAKVKNVLGVLEGRDPRADETIVIGAHMDHLGYGESGTLAPGVKEIHNGADDNASGTTGVIELARRLARRDQPLARRVLFATFTGEERGLLGSEHYVKNPAVPLEKTVTMINLDMIGRLKNEKLIVEGVGTAKEFRPLVESLNSTRRFKLSPVTSGIGPSDQTSFYQKRIPVLFFWTDYHPDYHRPSDDWDKISLEGLDRVIGLVEDVAVELANAESRPEFIETPMKAPAGAAADACGERPYLGSIPAFGEEVDGVLLTGVSPGSPAEKAGIRAGDTIVQFGAIEVHSLQDLQVALTSHKPGETVKVIVLREKERKSISVTLTRRSN